MKDVNKVILVGRIGADPVVRETKNGVKVVHFPLATARWVKDSGEGQELEAQAQAQKQVNERTQWHRVIVWGREAERCESFLKKGDSVYVEGAILSHRYESKEGEMKTAFEIHATSVSFLGRGAKKRELIQENEVMPHDPQVAASG